MRAIVLTGLVTGFVTMLVAHGALQASELAPTDETRAVKQDGYATTDGAALYAVTCQACHMADGQGAIGAGAYPKLANNENLEDPGYAITLVVNGYKAMPSFGRQMDDAQIAAVITYIRTHFGNAYAEPVSPDDVKAMRP